MHSTGLSAAVLTRSKLKSTAIHQAKPITFGSNSPRQTQGLQKDLFTRTNNEVNGALEDTIRQNAIVAETLSENLAPNLRQASAVGGLQFITRFLHLTQGADSLNHQDTINDGLIAAARHGQQETLPLLLNVNREPRNHYIKAMKQVGIRAAAIAAAGNIQPPVGKYSRRGHGWPASNHYGWSCGCGWQWGSGNLRSIA